MRNYCFVICLLLAFFGLASFAIAETVTVVGVDGTERTYEFDDGTESIRLSKTIPEIRSIRGLAQFEQLHKLTINFSDVRQTDFDFLNEIDQLRVLRLGFVKMEELDFLARLQSLQAFAVHNGSSIESLECIDFGQSSSLEVLSLNGVGVPDVPKLRNTPASLEYVDFYGVDFSHISRSRVEDLPRSGVTYFFSNDYSSRVREFAPDLSIGEVNLLRDVYDQAGF